MMCVHVVATEPTCSTNISLFGNAVHESDFVEINCTIDYKGRWMPDINCSPEIPHQVIENTSSHSRVSYIVVMSAADIGDWTVIRCQTKFVLPEWSTSESKNFEILPDTPQYNHTWHTLPIRVFNTTGNTCHTIKVSAMRLYFE